MSVTVTFTVHAGVTYCHWCYIKWTGTTCKITVLADRHTVMGTDTLFIQFSTVQFKIVSMSSEKPTSKRATPPLRSFPNVAFETVPLFL